MTTPKLRYILQALREHPNEWLSAGEISMLCRAYGRLPPTSKEVGLILSVGIANKEQVKISDTRFNGLLKYRYVGAI